MNPMWLMVPPIPMGGVEPATTEKSWSRVYKEQHGL
jgi:hypothetical protein